MNKLKLQFVDKLVISTPLFPLDGLTHFESAWPFLGTAFENALLLVSPNLLKKLQEIQVDADLPKREMDKIKQACFEYWSRAHSRCTPLGLFANCSVGVWNEATQFQIPPFDKLQLHTRLDMNYLCQLGKHLEMEPDIKRQVRFFLNNSSYGSDSRLRYVFYTYDSYNNRTPQFNEVVIEEYLWPVLNKAKAGARLEALAELLVDDEITLDDAMVFMEELVEAQLLVSELEVAITGPAYADQILSVLERLDEQTPVVKKYKNTLRSITICLRKLDQRKINKPKDYDGVLEQVAKLGVPFDTSKLFQTDTFKVADQPISLEKKLQRNILHAIEFLYQLLPPRKDTLLEDFIQKFSERYEGQRVRLVDVLDIEKGIGFPVSRSTVYNNVIGRGVVGGRRAEAVSEIQWTAHERFLQSLLGRFYYDGACEIDLQAEREKFLRSGGQRDSFPPTFFVSGKLLGRNKDGKLMFQLGFVGGRSGINLLGRFAHDSPEIMQIVTDAVAFEKSKNEQVLLCEIVHLPLARTGNILKHPRFLDSEICYLAQPSVAPECQLPIDDLELFLEGRRLVLWSKKMGKELIPRLSNAHDYRLNALPVYGLLCALQGQGVCMGLQFAWGKLSLLYDFFPRIKLGNVILKEAHWHLKEHTLQELKQAFKGKSATKEDIFRQFRAKRNIPDRFLLVEENNKLLVDCNIETSLNGFIDVLQNKKQVVLAEFLFDEYENIAKDHAGCAYANEVIALLYNPAFERNPVRHIPQQSGNSAFYMPGSEWLYFKIYCGFHIADKVLTNYVKPFLDDLKKMGCLEKWFFIRYGDPEHHLRLRLHLKDLNKLGTVQQQFATTLQPLVEQDIISRLQLDTYKREMNRYGPETMTLAEHYFYIDSENILLFLSTIEGEIGEVFRWQYTIVGIDILLNAAGFQMEEKKNLLTSISASFCREFGFDKNMKKSLDKKFRTHQDTIKSLLHFEGEGEEMTTFFEILRLKNQSLKLFFEQLLPMVKTSQAYPTLPDLLGSYIHMLCNRVFVSNQRFHEMVIYYLLAKYYTAEAGQVNL